LCCEKLITAELFSKYLHLGSVVASFAVGIEKISNDSDARTWCSTPQELLYITAQISSLQHFFFVNSSSSTASFQLFNQLHFISYNLSFHLLVTQSPLTSTNPKFQTMPSYSSLFVTLLLSTNVLALPLPQLAGEGAACDSILSSTDNGVGYGVENAENNVAATISSVRRRQLAGEGAACNSVLSSTDNGVGYGIENAENNVASTISGTSTTGSTAGSGGAAPAPAPKPKPGRKGPKNRRQLDKIANGFGAVANAAHAGAVFDPVVAQLDNVDGESTSGAANLGAKIGQAEESTLERVGKSIPKRQLDKIAGGFRNIGNAAHVGAVTDRPSNALINMDGTLTSGAANIGANAGSTEENLLEEAGNAV